MPGAIASTEERLENFSGSCPYYVPDLSYASKELYRALQSPTQDDYAKLKHAIRYTKGTSHYCTPIPPNGTTTDDDTCDVITYLDSDWAGCATTTNSTTKCTTTFRGIALHHYS